MPVIIEAVDLGALCAILLLIGLLIAVAYTFDRLANVLDVSIVGVRPFHGVSVAIENTIVAGCNAGIRALGSVAHDLWLGAKWSFAEVVKALMYVPNMMHRALDYLWTTAVPNYVKAVVAPLTKEIHTIRTQVTNLVKDEAADVLELKTRITQLAQAVPGEIETQISGAAKTLHHDFTVGIDRLRGEVNTEIDTVARGIGNDVTSTIDKLRTAENAAIGAVRRAEDATATELRDFIKGLDLTNLESVLAAVPLVAAAVSVLEAETGLGRAECRAKIKGICGTDANQWLNLLGSLVLLELTFDLREWVEAIVQFASASSHLIEDVVT